MRKGIVTILVMAGVLCCAGCEFFAGVGSGAALRQIAAQQEKALQENIDLVAQKNFELQDLLAKAEEPAEQARIEAALAANRELIESMQSMVVALRLTQHGLDTNWSDPTAVGGMSAAVIAAVMAWLQARRRKEAEQKAATEKSLRYASLSDLSSARKAGLDAAAEARAAVAKYQAHKQGAERVKLAHPDLAPEIYATIGEERAKLGVA